MITRATIGLPDTFLGRKLSIVEEVRIIENHESGNKEIDMEGSGEDHSDNDCDVVIDQRKVDEQMDSGKVNSSNSTKTNSNKFERDESNEISNLLESHL